MTFRNKPVRRLKQNTAESESEKAGRKERRKHTMKVSSRPGTARTLRNSADVLSGKGFSVQVGAYLDRHNAEKMLIFLKGRGYPAVIFTKPDTKGNTWHNVRIGVYSTRREAMNAGTKFYVKEKITTIVRPADKL